ncbi:MAG: TlpA family protein disulfide reductase, partial [Bacteroidales bacterium]|nr:TlpA family protein disulfide reductase [Bacteroidales bacterium]
MDTVYVNNGKFSWNPPVNESGVVLIVEPAKFIERINFYVVPGEYATIDGTMTNYEIGGSKFYKDWNIFHRMTADIDARTLDLFQRLMDATSDYEDEEEYPAGENIDYSEVDEAPENPVELPFDFHGEEQQIGKDRDDKIIEFIKGNKDSDFAAYLATEIGIKRFAEAEALLSETAKNGKMATQLENRRLSISGEEARLQALGKIYEGVEAPDFTLKTSTGDAFTLSDCRGKWVLLDFWGVWCHWCCEGIPNVRKVSETYKDKLQVVSVDCGDPESKWLEGIKKYDMTWTQVYNAKTDKVDSRYAVEGYPGFYLVDPEGIIRMISFGEPYNFVEKIGEYVK